MDTGMDTGMDMDGSSQLHPTWIRPRLGNTISRRSKVSLGTVPCPFIRNDKYGLPQVAGMGKMISYDHMTCRTQIDSRCALFRFPLCYVIREALICVQCEARIIVLALQRSSLSLQNSRLSTVSVCCQYHANSTTRYDSSRPGYLDISNLERAKTSQNQDVPPKEWFKGYCIRYGKISTSKSQLLLLQT